jgi:hypothetical protein
MTRGVSLETKWTNFVDAKKRYEDCANGKVYFSKLKLQSGGDSPWLQLPPSALARIKAQLKQHWFGMGFTWNQGGDRGITIDPNLTWLKVGYSALFPPPTMYFPKKGGRSSAAWTTYFSWGKVDPMEPYTYFLYCDSSPNPTTLIYSGPFDHYSWTGAVEGTKYYWKIRAYDGVDSATSEVWSFRKNRIPPTPVGLSPANGATVNPSASQTLSWVAGQDPDGDSLAFVWQIDTNLSYISSSYYLEAMVSGLSQTNTSKGVPTQPNKTYYWSVRAHDGTDYGPWSQVYSFKTGPAAP